MFNKKKWNTSVFNISTKRQLSKSIKWRQIQHTRHFLEIQYNENDMWEEIARYELEAISSPVLLCFYLGIEVELEVPVGVASLSCPTITKHSWLNGIPTHDYCDIYQVQAYQTWYPPIYTLQTLTRSTRFTSGVSSIQEVFFFFIFCANGLIFFLALMMLWFVI